MKKLTKRQRKQIERVIRRNLNKSLKKNTTLLEKQLKETQETIGELAADLDLDLQEHHIKHRNSVFVPMLDEATGEKTYEPRSFDEILAECENDKKADDLTRYDHLYDMLDESSEYEWNTYYADSEGDLLEEDRWADREKELAAGGETAGHDAEGNPKSMGQKAKEKVKGGIEAVKSTWKKGKLYFFLKSVEQGLKVALTFSRSFQKVITRLVVGVVTKIIGGWIKTKGKIAEAWAKIGAAIKEKVTPLISKLMKPFLWIAEKLTGDMEKAVELAPVLFSIAMTSITLAYLYMTCGTDMIGGVTGGASASMQEVVAELPTEMAAEMGCAAAGAVAGAAMSEAQLLKEEFACNIIDEQGKQVSNKVCMEVIKIMDDRIKTRAEDVISSFESHISVVKNIHAEDPSFFDKIFGNDGIDRHIEMDKVTKITSSQAASASSALQSIRSNVEAIGNSDSMSMHIDIRGKSIPEGAASYATDYAESYRGHLRGFVGQAQKYSDLLPDATDAEINDALDTMVWKHQVEGSFKSLMTSLDVEGKLDILKKIKHDVSVKAVDFMSDIEEPVSGAAAAAEPAPGDSWERHYDLPKGALSRDKVRTIVGKSSETFDESLSEGQVKRLKKLAGIV